MSLSRKVVPLCVAAGLAACGQTKMVQTTGQIRDQVIAGNYPGALATLRQSKNEGFKEQDRVVFWMNEGMLLHLTGAYKESAAVLERAEQRSKELYTKRISKSIKAAFTSDAATDYEGEDYEKVLINVVKALDYLGLANLQEAMVEARKITEKLKLYNTKYQGKNVYNQDAFAHWMMGLLYEMEGSQDDARIAYVQADELYQSDFAGKYNMKPPSYVAEDAARAALASGDQEVLQRYREKYGPTAGQSLEKMKTMGEIVLVNLNGEGPSKSDYVVTCWFLSAVNWACDGEPGGEFMKKTTITIPSKGTVIKVAFPELHIHEPVNGQIEIGVGTATARSEPALPISRIAMRVMADKMGRIWRDAIIRVITKTLTSKAAGAVGKKAGGKSGGGLLGWAAEKGTSAVMQAFEEADKRAWTTLPSRIDVARLLVPPGTHAVRVGVPRGRGGTIPGVKVEAGKRVVITWRTIP